MEERQDKKTYGEAIGAAFAVAEDARSNQA